MLDDGVGVIQVLGQSSPKIQLPEMIALGHKVALKAIRTGEAVVKYGGPIGHATQDIRPGQWVHLHNCASEFDRRSQTLELHSGAATDTEYE